MNALTLAKELAQSGRAIPLGRAGGTDIYASREESVTVIGPPRCGKSSAVFIPAVALHPGPVVVTSLRPDVRDATIKARQTMAAATGGQLLEVQLDEAFPPSVRARPVSWDLTAGCQSWNTAQDRAAGLVTAAMTGRDEGHWRATSQKVLAAMLYVGARTQLDARTIRRKLDARHYEDVLEYLSWAIDYDEDSDAEEALAALTSVVGVGAAAPDELASIFSTLTSQVLGSLRYLPMSEAQALDPVSALSAWSTIYLTVRHERAEYMGPWISAFIEMLSATWRSGSVSRGSATLLLALDEVANVAPARSLPSLVTAGGGDGIQLLLGFQEPSQALKWHDHAKVMLSGTSHTVIFPGLLDVSFLREYTQLLGKQIKYDTHFKVSDDLPQGYRFASPDRLRNERFRIESEVSKYQDGWRNRLGQSAARLVALRLHTERIKDGISCRIKKPSGSEGVLAEILRFTSLETRSERREALDLEQLFKAAREREAFVRSRTNGHFRDFPRHYEDSRIQAYLA